MSTFVNNDVASGNIVYASDHNTQGALLAAVLNGGIDNANIAAGAAIDGSKLASDGVTDTQLDYPRWWQEIGRTTLGSAGDTITVSSLPARKYLKIIFTGIPSGAIDSIMRFNNDSGNNYAFRYSASFGAGTTGTSQSSIPMDEPATAVVEYTVVEIINIAAQEKIGFLINTPANTAGAGTAPGALDLRFKWANTSAAINRIDVINAAAGDFASGSEVVVLGHD